MRKKNSNIIPLKSVVTNAALINMSDEIKHLKEKHKKTCEMAARTILYALNLKDHYTFGHSTRVAYFSVVTGKELNLSDDELYDLELAALFHDIGKIGTPDELLNKPKHLIPEEFNVMKKHPQESYKILKQFKYFEKIALYAKHHHERYDGRGYPDQLIGESIPLFSRIILIADTFDAITSSRPYRKGLPRQVAFDELKRFSGTQFDPNLVDMFIYALVKVFQQKSTTFQLSILDQEFAKDAA